MSGRPQPVPVKVAVIDEIPPGTMLPVTVESVDYVVINVAGELHAIVDVCPHQGAKLSCGFLTGAMLPIEPGAPLEYGLEGEVIGCPWHRWKFSIVTGESLFHTDRRRLGKVPVRVEGTDVVLSVRPRQPRKLPEAAANPTSA